MTYFVTTQISSENCLIDLIPKNGKNSSLLSIINSKPLLENPSLKLETEFEYRTLTYSPGRFPLHRLHRKIFKMLQFPAENLQHTK